MNDFIKTQEPVIERSGMGLLPGIGMALAIALLGMGALTLHLSWLVPVVLVLVLGVTAAVVWVVWSLAGDGD